MVRQKEWRKEDRNEKTHETRSQTTQRNLRDAEMEVIRKRSERREKSLINRKENHSETIKWMTINKRSSTKKLYSFCFLAYWCQNLPPKIMQILLVDNAICIGIFLLSTTPLSLSFTYNSDTCQIVSIPSHASLILSRGSIGGHRLKGPFWLNIKLRSLFLFDSCANGLFCQVRLLPKIL